jgi:protein-tyrosine phosphatase
MTQAQEARVLAPGDSLGVALDIVTVPNLRDVGGYATQGGSVVARGLAHRSGTFHPMTDADCSRLASLRLKSNYDLRTSDEADSEPDRMPPGVAYRRLDVLSDATSSMPAVLRDLLQEPERANLALGSGKLDSLFTDSYREFIGLTSACRSYRTLFLALADPTRLPAVFHCTTGKDRTGWAAAALLSLLGVPRDAVMADYLRTNAYTLPQFRPIIDAFVAAGGERGIAAAVFGVKREYLEAAFDEVASRHGTIEGYFSEGLGIDAADQRALRDIYLVR